MSITDRINDDIKTAMKARESGRLAALRDIKSKLLLEMTKDGGGAEVADEVAMRILNKLYKQRVEAADIYKQQERADLYEEEMAQAAVIQAYLPEPMSEDELRSTIEEIVARVGANSMADMGKVMGVASKELGGKADGKAISAVVKSLLS